MSRHVIDVARTISEALNTDDWPKAWRASGPILETKGDTGFAVKDGTWVVYAGGDFRGFRITVEAVDLGDALVHVHEPTKVGGLLEYTATNLTEADVRREMPPDQADAIVDEIKEAGYWKS